MSTWLQAFRNMRFKQKLILSYLIVSFIPMALLGTYSYQQSKLFLRKQTIQGLQDAVGTIARGMSDKSEQYVRTVDSVVMNTGLQRILGTNYASLALLSEELRKYVDPFFRMIKSLNRDIVQLTVYMPNMPEYGDTILSVDRIKEDSGGWYNPSIQQKKTGWALERGELVVYRQFPTILYNNIAGVVYLKLNKEQFFESLSSFSTSESGRDGILITDGQRGVVYSNREDNSRLQQQIVGLPSQFENTVDIGGIRYIVINRPLPPQGWVIHYYIPERDISMDASSIVKATVVLIITCIAILIAFISLFSHTMIRRIYHLNKLMKQVQHGNLQMDVRSEHSDEIGELTNRFGMMLHRINELVTEVYENKIIQKEAEFKALQAQINPHFLYNTLSVINWKSLKIGASDISHVATTLSKFYRTSLNRGESITSVKDEVHNIQSFVDIQLVMHDHSFDVSYQIDDEVYRYDTVNLSIQPLVENAIMHGIDQKEEGRGKLVITAKACEDSIEFSVEDNGPGIEKALQDDILVTQSKGYGLKNVNERIKLMFGDGYGITVISDKGQGTLMKLTIPKYRKQ
ncbi:sensor histidine kinase [Paenibacillus piri]|uniref:histidine kinase n=1 Tax=Paenibacillus piri TaxID=2547395 RepID=A0A4R5KLQ8_9BACL|nr:histidine kinase [Paenibacillus piri]TDF96142.1 HAMP domain-containing protein [Paenibacillus piri]